MTDKAAKRDLRMLYRDIPPTSPCKPGCSDCCGPVPWSEAEIARVAADIPPIAEWIEIMGARGLLNPLTGKCPFASAEGCQVYDRRPFMCRLFATSIEETRLRCPHGCAPKKPLSGRQAAALTDRYIGAGGPPVRRPGKGG